MQLLADGSTILKESWPHTANIVVHVGFGTLALLLGLVQLILRKGGATHAVRGRWFLLFVGIVLATATLGLVLVRFHAVLAITALLTAYWSYSGWRALRIRGVGPGLQDVLVSVSALVAAGLFALAAQAAQLQWAAGVVYSILGTLVAVAVYDLARVTFPKRWFETLWLYEHLVKMIGAHASILSAFSGTVLWAWHPYSQVAPSMLWVLLMIAFVIRVRRRTASSPLGVAALASPSL